MTPASTDVFSDETFHLPLTGLFADVDAGSGCVRLTDDFEDCDLINRLRIVQDWQRDLHELRQLNLKRLFQARFAKLNASRAEQIRHFNRYCEQHGLECPPELTAGLVETTSWAHRSTAH